MTEKTNQTKKRVMKNVTFEHENAHLALCSKEQGVANQADYALVLKSSGATEDFIEKVQNIQITLSLPEFLKRFFHIWEEDADVLATMMGYVEPAETTQMQGEEANQEMQKWISDRMVSFEIIKSLKDESDPISAMSSLSQDQILQVLQDQSEIEGFITQIEKAKNTKEIELQKEKQQIAELQKSLNDSMVELQKAHEELNKFKIEKQEAINKARKDSLKEVLADEKVEGIFKALESASDESFAEVVSVMKSFKEQVEKSNLFKETGASTEEDNTIEKSPLEKALHARLKKTSN